jgi:Flp pilus assembly protein TadD
LWCDSLIPMTSREQPDTADLKPIFSRTFASPMLIGGLLAAVTLIVFWPVTRCDFLNYDDPDYFTANHHVLSGLTPASFVWAFTTGHASNWHPLTWLSLMLDAQIFGKNPFGPHLTNLLFHAVNTTLLFLLLRKLTSTTWRSAFVAALFGWHPLHVESVAWVAERKDVLSTFFALLSLWAYAGHAQKFKSLGAGLKPIFASRDYWLAFFFFALALMSKPMVVTLPFVMLLLDWWPLHRFTIHDSVTVSRLLSEKIPFFALSMISCVITFIVQKKGGAVTALLQFSMPERIGNAFVSYARYLAKTCWPDPLANPYPLGHWESSLVVCSVALVAGLSAIAILFARRFPFVFTGWFWFTGALVPVIGLVQVGIQSMADRYTYFPLIGIFIVFIWGIGAVCVNVQLPRPVIIFLTVIVLIACALRTRNQLKYWHDNETLFRHTLAVTGDNYTAYINLGTWMSEHGHFAEAMDLFHNARRMNPEDSDVLYNMGNALAKTGDLDGAIDDYRRALQILPNQTDVLDNLGFALAAKKQFAGAIENFEAALKLKPDFADAHNNLATVLFIQHRFAEAAQHYREAIRLTPGDPQIYTNLGDTLVKLGEIPEAIQNYNTALSLRPDDTRIRAKLQALGAQISN